MIDYASAKKIRFGADGSGGGGEDGATFFPTVSEEGIISWTNNGGYINPDPVNIKGQDGTVEFDELTPAQKAELKGDKGDAGVTPNLIMEVNVDPTTGTPDVEVTKTGTTEQPVFNLQFSGLKGETGQTGYSPSISVQETATGHDVTVINESGSSTFSVNNGIDGQVGTTPNISANAVISGTTGTPSVNVTKAGTLENPLFSFNFQNIKGEQGQRGETGSPGRDGLDGSDGRDGVTPDITMEVSVDGTSKENPTATVTRSGTLATPTYNVAFSGLKGNKGDKGDTGSAPNISATATVNSNTGTPSVIVTKSGTTDNPSFAFDFQNLKGDRGEKGEDGTIGTTPVISATASVDNNVGTPLVTVTKSGDIHTPNFDFAFENIKGAKGDAPDITATATVSSSQGTPSVNVTKSGTSENPNFAFAFSGLKGETGLKGDKGDTGNTPNISATATVDSNTGTPSVNVTKSGTVDNPSFTFSFQNIKGEKGDDGTIGTTPNISASASVSNTVGIPSVTVTKTGDILTPNFAFDFTNIKGQPGNDGVTPDMTATATVDSNVGIPSVDVTKGGTTSNPTYAFAFHNIKGEKGDTGSQGIQGEPGVQGVPGIAGQDGITYTPEIGTITTVDAFEDADASVTIQGTRAIFNFSIPKGEKGDSGSTGVNILQYTMLLTGWVDNIYSFEGSYPFASYNLEIEPNGDLITPQQLRAWNEGQMTGSYSHNQCIAMGDVPTMDIPVILKVASKGS